VAHLDRKKHDWDVLEHVYGGVRTVVDDDAAHTEVVSIDVRPWLAGTTTSVVQVTVNGMAEQQSPGPSTQEPKHNRHEQYESDRRGEHKYPQTNRDADRPSQRERDDLKDRLERKTR
jgi:hypothetical protein